MKKLMWLIIVSTGLLLSMGPVPGAEPRQDRNAMISQTSLLEATRQDMIAYRLSHLASEIKYLAKDLRSNGITDRTLNRDLADLAARIKSVQSDQVGKVRAELNELGEQDRPHAGRLRAVRRDIRHIVRKLAVLLLEAGVRHATEVFATRLEDIIGKQRQLIDRSPDPQTAVAAQREVIAEIRELMQEMRSLDSPLEKPLAAVRLARVRKIIGRGDTAELLAKAARALKAPDAIEAEKRQSAAVSVLQEARKKLRPVEESEQRKKVRKRRVIASSRLDRLRAYQDRQLDFVADLQDAVSEGSGAKRLISVGKRQLTDMTAFMDSMEKDDRWMPPVRSALQEGRTGMKNAVSDLEKGKLEEALRESRTVIGSLRRTASRMERKVTVLEEIESHLELAEDMRYTGSFLKDIENEQKDLAAKAETKQRTERDQRVVGGALGELRETLAGVSGSASVDRPMQKAGEVIDSLTEKKKIEAPERRRLQKKAKKHIDTAGNRADSLARRAAYVAEWLDYLGRRQAALLSLLARQIALRKRTERAPERVFAELRGEQDSLLGETQSYAANMEEGQSSYASASEEMQKAVPHLKKTNRDRAVHHQRRAEEALRKAAKALAELVGHVAEITTLERMGFFESETHILTKVMMIAVEQRHVRERTRTATREQMRKFTRREQLHLMQVTRKLAASEEIGHFPQMDSLPEAADEMEKAADDLKNGARTAAIKHQQKAEKTLRTDMADLVSDLLKVQDVGPAVEAEGGGGDALAASTSMPMESVRIFGKPPAHIYRGTVGGKSTWEPLSPRQRSALSEHFARELPLPYRGLLKAYYRSLAEE